MILLTRLLMLTAVLATAPGCDWIRMREPAQARGENERRLEREAQLRRACASELTYDRLKEYAFDEAQRIRGGDGRLLDRIATGSLVRMEDPVVRSRDEVLNVTVCTGRFVLELPQGAANAFDGERRLVARVEYAAQAAVDGSGLVYQMTGAEPIIYRLATVGGLSARPGPRQVATVEPVPQPPVAAPAAPAPVQAPQTAEPPAQAPRPRPEQRAQAPAGSARPSYNCRQAGTRTERMVCANSGLAASDRRMASAYYAAMAQTDGETRGRLRRTRDRFLARRERCANQACVAAVYEERVREIREIAGQ
jgi:uncharacterized protein YecT (DUF1311 family)